VRGQERLEANAEQITTSAMTHQFAPNYEKNIVTDGVLKDYTNPNHITERSFTGIIVVTNYSLMKIRLNDNFLLTFLALFTGIIHFSRLA